MFTATAVTVVTTALTGGTIYGSMGTLPDPTVFGAMSTLPDPTTFGAMGTLPDVTVLGKWTYLATEIVFGSVALALTYRAGALRRAARTIGVLYPVAYVWDWYTLQVGVFAIPMRTGVELLAIPLEEHLFIVVVPLLVVGIHETLHGRPSYGLDGRDRPDEQR